MATNAAFLTAVQGLTVTGVTRHYDEPPRQIHTAELPVAFPMMPAGGLGEKLLSCFDTNKTRRIQFVVCLEAVGQGTQPQNYGLLAAAMDNLETALDGLEKSQGGTLANFIEYEISAEIFEVAGNTYWAIVADLSARDV
jgi:hypothetical protein